MRSRKFRYQCSLMVTAICLFFTTITPVKAVSSAEHIQKKKQVAIVIDDFGNNMSGTEEIINLPFPLTIAVMPFLPTTKRDAEWAYQHGHDVLVHLPMEPLQGRKQWLGPGAITSNLTDDEIKRRVHAAIDNVPHAIGINNHMGSKITADPHIMRLVLEVCRTRGMVYLDSKTNYRSVVSRLAGEIRVPYVENHIFLDDVNSIYHIAKQCQLIQRHLQEHDVCIAIGHVGRTGKKTAAVLKDKMSLMQGEIEFVKISQLREDLTVPSMSFSRKKRH